MPASQGDGAGPLSLPAAPVEGLRVEDPRQLRRQLEGEVASSQGKEAFLAGLAEVLADEGMLRQALLPMVVTSQVRRGGIPSLIGPRLQLLWGLGCSISLTDDGVGEQAG